MLILFIISAELVGFVSGLFSVKGISSWYAFLIKPVFSPPNWIFGPVWVSLYAIMGAAAYFVWRQGRNQDENNKKKTYLALRLYWAQLFFNFLWSIIFFGANNIWLALVDIIILWVLIVTTTVTFFKVKKLAGWLFVPYLLWVSFALVLNFSLFTLNNGTVRPNMTPPKSDIVNNVTFFCPNGKNVKAVFHTTNIVDLTLSDGRVMSLPRAISADGARYTNANESFVFWNKGDTAFIQEKGIETYTGCALK